MLICKGIVVTKDAKGDLSALKAYDRVYLNFGPNDEIETVDKTVNGKKVGDVTRPKGDRSVHAPQDLMRDALTFLQSKFPKSDPVGILLESADYGLDLKAQAPIRQSITPGKPIDEDKATEKTAKLLVAMGKFPTLDAATAFVRSLEAASAAAK